MYLEEIATGASFENDRFECKGKLNRDDVTGWLKSVAGFANAHGGDFYIGVEDKTNKLMGFDRKEADNERNFFNNQVNLHLVPRPQMSINFIRYEVRNKEKFLIHVNIPESLVKPVVLKHNGVPSIYMRRDGFTNGATYEEIIEMGIKSRNTQYDVLISDIPYKSVTFNDLYAFHEKHCMSGKKLTEKKLGSMGFFDEKGMLANGALMFSDGYDDKKTEVMCSVFSGFNKGSDRIVTVSRHHGNLTSVIEFMLEFVKQRMNHSIVKVADGRRDIDAFPERALFEGIINAVAHRDYYLDGTQIQVDMFRDRLEISSPGGFYRGEKIGKTYDLSRIISKRRNELITAVLVSCNVMEAGGTGFDKITEEYMDADEAHRPYIFSSSDHFTLVLPDLTYSAGIEDSDIPAVIFTPVPNGTEQDEKVLSFCYKRAHKASEIAEYLGISDSTYLRNKILGNMEKNDYLIKSRISKACYYKTNPDIVKIE